MKKSLLLLGTVLIVLILFSLGFWLYEAQYFVGRATTVRAGFSRENSYLFVSPLQAKANSLEKIRLTVFVLNNQGLGIAGYKVVLDENPALKVEAVQGSTDSFGKAVFDVSTGQAGEYFIKATVEDRPLLQEAHLRFN